MTEPFDLVNDSSALYANQRGSVCVSSSVLVYTVSVNEVPKNKLHKGVLDQSLP